MKKALLALLALFVVASLYACGEEEAGETATSPIPEPKAAKKTVAPPEEVQAPEETAAPEYSYDPTNRRDPFKSLLDVQRPVVAQDTEPMTPLQRFDLGQIRLLGVIVGLDEPEAMIVAPDGKSYILRVGTKIGKNSGSVVDISAEGVFIEEKYFDFAGEVRKNVQSLELPKREGVK